MKRKALMAALLGLALAFGRISAQYFPPTMTSADYAAENYRVLQRIDTLEMLAVAADCMTEEGYDESDMHEALADAMRGGAK